MARSRNGVFGGSVSLWVGLALVAAVFGGGREAVAQGGIGACCLPDGTCIETGQSLCDLIGEEFFGPGSTCGQVVCTGQATGACCLGAGECFQTMELVCQDLGGTYLLGETCTPTLCAPPAEGACCTNQLGCVIVVESECAALGGQFAGPGSVCEQPGVCQPSGPDRDGDGVIDDQDNCPDVWNPSQNGGLCAAGFVVAVDQADWYGENGVPLAVDSDYGMFGIGVENPGDRVVWVNARIDGVWHVQNWPVSGIDFAIDHPIERHWTTFEIGPRGVDVTQVAVAFTVTAEPLDPLGTFPPLPDEVVSVGAFPQQKGKMGPGPDLDPAPLPAFGSGRFEFSVGAVLANIETAARPDFNLVDLDEASEENSCGPAAVASSFKWLDRTYALSLDDALSKSDLLDELERRMMTDPRTGTDMGKLVETKKRYIRKNKLPLTVESQGRGTPNPGAVSPEDLFKEMKKGQDVEIFIRFGGAMNDDKGHMAALVEMKKENGKYTITTLDDGAQTAAGSNNRRLSGELKMEGGEWVYTDAVGKAKLVGWASESPTEAAINRAITDGSAGLSQDLQDGAGTDAQVGAWIKRACLLEFQVCRLLDNAELRDPPASANELSTIRMMKTKIILAKLYLFLARAFPAGSPERVAYLAMARGCLDQLNSLSDALRDRLPSDMDDDGIPDDMDNAPNSANPDQEDCDGDGTGDVEQLDLEDCNDNGQVDSCDIAAGESMDINSNGVPDECECPCDWDSSGVQDLNDYFVFLGDFFAQLNVGNPQPGSADFDGDGVVTLNDYFAFLACLPSLAAQMPCP